MDNVPYKDGTFCTAPLCLLHVNWAVNREPFHEGTNQVVLDTSHISVYDNRLRMTGKVTGHYLCLITNNVGALLEHNEVVNGKSTHIK